MDSITRNFGAIVLCVLLASGVAVPQSWGESRPPRPLGIALDEMRQGDWADAHRVAARDGAAAQDVIMWHALRAGRGNAADVVAFLNRHPDWPGLAYLREKSEPTMAEGANPEELRLFFAAHTPETGVGALAYARALEAQGSQGSAEATIVLAWRTLILSSAEQDAFLARYGDLLVPHHTARLSMLLWRKAPQNAGRMMALVPDAWHALTAARIGLQGDVGDVNALIDAVPAALADDPGMAFDRFMWRIDHGYTDSARDLLLERSVSAASLGQPQKWANWRRILTRREMREGSAALAYRIAATHHLTGGSAWADLEWLAGFIALRHLNDPARALIHFKALSAEVESPISKGRAGYWIGRAYDILGDREGAEMAYAAGAQHQTSFYGLLAAERAGISFDTTLAGAGPLSDWRTASFVKSSMFQVSVLLIAANERSLAERFVRQMAETLSEPDLVALGDAMIELGEPHLAVMVGKEAAARSIVLPRAYYALHPVAAMRLPVSSEFALAIARRESEFDPNVVSPVGARGLMQLMPRTAQAMAEVVGEPYDSGALTADPAYNARLGSAYLARLEQQFDGNPVMMAAAYNAGPSRPQAWMAQFGDPRRPGADIVDWIEMIPFRETRNYVMRVAESLPVYRARLGRDPLPMPFSESLQQ